MRIHELKTDTGVFLPLYSGDKTFEIRFNDRDFKMDDVLILKETVFTGVEMKENGKPLEFTGAVVFAQVGHVLEGPVYGLKEGWVVLSLRKNQMSCWRG